LIPYADLNANGEWDADENEPLNDDLGKDVIPFDFNTPDQMKVKEMGYLQTGNQNLIKQIKMNQTRLD
jgi:hypothetical protein